MYPILVSYGYTQYPHKYPTNLGIPTKYPISKKVWTSMYVYSVGNIMGFELEMAN